MLALPVPALRLGRRTSPVCDDDFDQCLASQLHDPAIKPCRIHIILLQPFGTESAQFQLCTARCLASSSNFKT